ncbi:hypothetical protein M1D97_00320 [Kushneria sp. AK178]
MNINNVISAAQSTQIDQIHTFDKSSARQADPSDFILEYERKKQLGINPPSADNTEDQIYSKIIMGGKEVATVYNSGVVKTLNQHQGLELSTAANRIETAEKRTQQLLEQLQGSYISRPS